MDHSKPIIMQPDLVNKMLGELYNVNKGSNLLIEDAFVKFISAYAKDKKLNQENIRLWSDFCNAVDLSQKHRTGMQLAIERMESSTMDVNEAARRMREGLNADLA